MDSPTGQQTANSWCGLNSSLVATGCVLWPTPITGSWREVLSSGRCRVSEEGQAEHRAVGDGPSFAECECQTPGGYTDAAWGYK